MPKNNLSINTDKQSFSINRWSHSYYMAMNGKIYNTKNYQYHVKYGDYDVKDINEQNKQLQSAIDEGTRVPNNVITQREGHWDKGHKTGDVVVLKGFIATSYTGGMDVSGTDEKHLYKIDYCIPTGTKGLVLSPEQFKVPKEEELLLGKNTRHYVLEQNDDTHYVRVLVLPYR